MVWECVCVRTHACVAILMWWNVAAKIWLLQFLKILCMCGRASVLVQMFVALSVCRSQAAGVHAVWWAGPASCLGRNLPPIWPDHSQQHSVLDRLEQVSRSLCPEYVYITCNTVKCIPIVARIDCMCCFIASVITIPCKYLGVPLPATYWYDWPSIHTEAGCPL